MIYLNYKGEDLPLEEDQVKEFISDLDIDDACEVYVHLSKEMRIKLKHYFADHIVSKYIK